MADSATTPTTDWSAPQAPYSVDAVVTVPGSKSETNRALVLAALSDGPSTITGGLVARDSELMISALRSLGAKIDTDAGTPDEPAWRITPPARLSGGVTIDCGLAGTVMRFVAALAALTADPVKLTGDPHASQRPMQGLLDGLGQLGATVEGDALPCTITGPVRASDEPVVIDSSASSQFVSALLLIGPHLPDGIEIRHEGGTLPSRPHILMTVQMLNDHGVRVDVDGDRWVVHPGPIAALDVHVEPDLSNAAPFLAAAAVTMGTVTIPHWPMQTLQPGDQLRHIFDQFGCETALDDSGFTVTGVTELDGIEVDLSDASELTPVVAAVAALAQNTSHIHGVGHIRGHETDRIAALDTELTGLGAKVDQLDDGLSVHPAMLHGNTFGTYADHRMAHAGAVLGLVVHDVVLDDIGCTSKTMPEFPALWAKMISDTVAAVEAAADGEDGDAIRS
ncbi:3-phosphoshikimate 1-carboxyvinyltransferase [Propionibacteriaceae bacterium Y2011]|uniref:3-phosphoshikimate 1-carboxyvinyltransferase n=1 Tax=Microlunatus sp. Y2014 TaxID=3418488 RepID=UPI003B4ADE3F